MVRGLLSTNVGSREIREVGRLLLVGSCVIDEYPDIFEKYRVGRVPLKVCMEREHINMVALKIASILARLEIKEVVILTVDGSPHCISLHHAVEEAVKVSKSNTKVVHIVIERGKDITIDNKAVKIARYLSKVNKLIKKD